MAHGISSMVEGEKVIIGSAHFVFEDERLRHSRWRAGKIRAALTASYSHLYLCIGGTLAAVLCIWDPLRKEASQAVQALHDCGISNVVMMTGDNHRTAQAVARAVGVDEVHAEVLPEDKAAFIRQAREEGHVVIMVGDGVNDSPALSEADVGIAISTGAAIAREIADITVSSEDLMALVTLRQLSCALMARIHRNYQFIIGFNLQPDRSGCGRHPAPDDQRPAAQYVHPWHQHEEHDESAVSIPKEASPHSGHGAVLRNAGTFYASVHRTVTRLLPPTVQVKRVRSYSPESMPSTSSGARVSRAATR